MENERALDPKKILKEAIAERCAKNPQYSIRAFARHSGISHTVLSLVLSGKRKLSKKAAQKLAFFLGLDPQAKRQLMRSYEPIKSEQGHQDLSLDIFAIVSDWYHYAILSALELPQTVFEARPVSKLLKISILQAKVAIERLKKLELVEQNSQGRWKQSVRPIKIDNEYSTAATKKFHKQVLSKALDSLENDPFEVRDFTSMTFAMNRKNIEYARKKIKAFRRKLVADLEAMGEPDCVYNFTMQLYPVSALETNKKENKK